jgi:hypothetical protein
MGGVIPVFAGGLRQVYETGNLEWTSPRIPSAYRRRRLLASNRITVAARRIGFRGCRILVVCTASVNPMFVRCISMAMPNKRLHPTAAVGERGNRKR